MLSAHRNYAFGPNEIQRPAAEPADRCVRESHPPPPDCKYRLWCFPSSKQWTMLKSTPSLHTNTVGGAPSQGSQGRFSTCTQPCKCPSQSRGLGSPGGTSGGMGLSSLANSYFVLPLSLFSSQETVLSVRGWLQSRGQRPAVACLLLAPSQRSTQARRQPCPAP